MLNQSELIKTVAAYKKDSRRVFDSAVTALIALAWPYRSKDFVFDESFGLIDEAYVICQNMTDECIDRARARMEELLGDSLDYYDDDAAWDYAFDEDDRVRLDQAGSHLLELIAVWLHVATTNGWTQGYTRVVFSRYLTNPFLCPEWSGIPLNTLAWGRGYAKDISEQIAIIGQGLIVEGARHAERVDAMALGYNYYIRRRGSTFDCDTCDEMANKPIPIDIEFEIPHPRCVCYPEFIK